MGQVPIPWAPLGSPPMASLGIPGPPYPDEKNVILDPKLLHKSVAHRTCFRFGFFALSSSIIIIIIITIITQRRVVPPPSVIVMVIITTIITTTIITIIVPDGRGGKGKQFEKKFTMASQNEYVMYKKVGWEALPA